MQFGDPARSEQIGKTALRLGVASEVSLLTLSWLGGAIRSMTPKTFNINRRRFLQTTAALTAATGVPAWFLELEQAQAAQPRPLGPNDRPGVALVGCGGQGRGDCSGAANFG